MSTRPTTLGIRCVLALLSASFLTSSSADEAFDKLLEARNYADAIKYADEKLPVADRNAAIWAKLGIANEAQDLIEKALACYMVAIRNDAQNYEAHLGAARINNKLGQHETALVMAKKALALKSTREASWESAQACLALKCPDIKAVLEKVIESDNANVTAAKELGIIYFNEKAFDKAVPLLKTFYNSQTDGEIAFKLAVANQKLENYDSAAFYYKEAIRDKRLEKPEVILELAKIYSKLAKYDLAADAFAKTDLNKLSADDLYNYAFCAEKAGLKKEDYLNIYASSTKKYGSSNSKEALLAKYKVGVWKLETKNFKEALDIFLELGSADPKGQTVSNIPFLTAEAYDGLGERTKAIPILEKIIAADNNNVEAFARLADLYTKEKMADKAQAVYEKLLSLQPNNPKVYSALGEYSLKTKKFEDAWKYYQKSYALDQKSDAAIGMMFSAWEQKKVDLARDAAESALHIDSKLKEPKLILAKINISENNYPAAEQLLASLTKDDPSNLELWTLLATCYEQLKNTAKLAEADKSILALDKKNIPSRIRFAQFALSSNDLDNALPVFKELAVLTPKDASVFKSLFDISMKKGNTDDAIEFLTKYVNLKPQDASAQKDLGNLYYDKKNNSAALKSYQAALKADPAVKGFYKKYVELVLAENAGKTASVAKGQKSPQDEIVEALNGAVAAGEADVTMYKSLAEIYKKSGDNAKAVQMYEKASQLDNKDLGLLSSLAESQAKSGNTSAAIMTYEQVIAMNPQASAEYKILGDLYKKDKKTESSIKNYKKYLEKNADNDLAQEVGEYAYNQKNYAEAVKYLAMVTGADASKVSLMKMLADASFQTKDDAKAYEMYKKVGEKSPSDAEVFKNLYQLAGKVGTKDEVFTYLKKYVALKSSDIDAQRALAEMYYERKDASGALKCYRAVLKADPAAKGFYKKYVELVLAENAGKTAPVAKGQKSPQDEIVEALNGAVAAGEADVTMYKSLAEIYKKSGDHAKAVQMYEKASQLDNKDLGLLSSLAESQAKSGNTSAAIMTYEQVIAMNPQASAEYKILGDLYKKDKKTESSIKNYKKYLEKNADNDLAQEVGEYAYNQKNYAEAVKYLAMVTGADASKVSLMKMLADASFQTKDDAKAYEMYKKVGEKSPSDAEVFKNLYQLAGKVGTKDEVFTYLKKYAALKSSDIDAQRALAEMYYERKDASGALKCYRAVLKADPAAKGFYKKYVELVLAENAGKTASVAKGQKSPQDEIVEALNGAVAAGEADVTMYKSLAEIYKKSGDNAKAVQMYEKASQLDNKDLGLLSSLAESQAKSGNTSAAIMTYEQVIAMNPQASAEYKILGDLYKKDKKTESSIKNYKKYLEKNADNDLAQEVGEYAYNQKNYAEAVKYLAMVTGADASKVSLMKMLADASFQTKDDAKAYEMYKKVGEKSPSDAEVFKNLYQLAGKVGTKDEVFTYLKKYAALKSSDIDAQRALAEMYYERKDASGALKCYRAVLKADPAAKGFYKKYVELVLAENAGKTAPVAKGQKSPQDEIVEALNGAVAAGEADVTMYKSLAEIYKKSGDHAKAVQMYEKASQLDNKDLGLLSSLAESQAKSGNTSAAIMTYEQVIAMNPQASAEYKILGDLYKKDKKTDQSIKNYKKYLEKNADNGLAKEVGEYAYNQKNYAEAVKYLAMVTGADASKVSLMKMLADASFQTKDDAKAYEMYKKVGEKSPSDAEVFKNLYQLAGKVGTKDEVFTYLKKYVALKSSDIDAQRALAEMYYNRKDASGALACYRAVLKADPAAKGFYKKYVELVLAENAGKTAPVAKGQKSPQDEIVEALNGAVAAGEADVTMYKSLAEIYKKSGDHAKAVQMYEKASQLDNKDLGLLSSLAESQAKSGNTSAAIMTYEQVIAMNPKASAEYKILGDLYKKDKKTDQSIKNYKKYLEKNADNGLAKEVGEYAYTHKDYPEAVKYFAMVSGADASNVALLKMYADASLQAKDEFKAYQLFKQVGEKSPSDAEVFKNLYHLAGKAGTKDEVFTYLKKYVALKPSDIDAQRALAEMYYDRKDASGALACYRAVLKADPSAKGFYKKYVELVLSENANKTAPVKKGEKSPQDLIVEALNGAVAAGEADVTMYKMLAEVYTKSGNHAKAVQMYEKASQLDTKDLGLLSSLAESQAKSGNTSAAIMTYEQVIAMNPQASAEYKILGDLYKKDKKTDQSIKNYKKYLEKNADNGLAKEVGEYAYTHKNYPEAVKYFAMVSGADASNVALLKMYADASLQAKDEFKAYQLFKQVGEKSPSDAEVFKHLYQIAGKAGTKDEVFTYLKKYVALKPSDIDAQRALAEMYYERKDASGALKCYRAVLKADPAAKGFYKKYVELVLAENAGKTAPVAKGQKSPQDEIVEALNGAVAAGEADVTMYKSLAEIYKKSGDHAKAVQMYEKASQLDNKDLGLLSSLAESQAKSGNTSAAIMTYEQVIAMNPKASAEYKILGDLYKKDKKTDQSIKNYKKYLEKNADNGLAKEVGEYAYTHKDYPEAVKYFAMVSGADASNVALLKMYANASLQAKDEFKAYQIFKQVGEKSSSDAEVFKNLYHLAGKAGTKDEVFTYLKKYVALKPSDIDAQRALAEMYYDRKDASGALACYRAVLKADPSAKGFYKKYVELVLSENANKTAPVKKGEKSPQDLIVEALNGAVAAGEADVTMYKMLAEVYTKSGNHAKAVQMYEKASQLDTKDLGLLSSLAESQAKSGNTSAAIMTYEQVIAMNPKASAEYKILGDLYKKDKKTDQSIKNYKKYLEKNSDNSLAKEVGEYAYTHKDYPEAVKYFAMISGADASNVALLKMYADASLQAKDEFKAYQLFKQVGEKSPSDAEVFKNLYLIAGKAGTKDEVFTYLKKYAALKPSDTDAQRALAEMYYDRKDAAGALKCYRAVLKADPSAKGFYKKYVELVLSENANKTGPVKSGEKSPQDLIVEALNGAVAAGEADVSMYKKLAEVYTKSGNHIKAVQMYEKAAALDTKDVGLLSLLAESQAKSGNLSAAVLTLEQAVAMNPAASEEYKNLGDLYMQQKKIDSAVKNYMKYLEKSQNNAIAKLVAENFYNQKKYSDAVKYFGMITGAEASEASMLFKYATSCLNAKDEFRAYQLYKQLANLTPKDPAVFEKLYEIAGRAGTKDEVMNYLKKYTELVPSDAKSLVTLADMLYDKKDETGALNAYRNALKADPGIKGIFKRYASLVMSSGSESEKVTALNGAINSGEADALMYQTLADIYNKQNLIDKAIPLYEKAAQLDTKNSTLLTSLAECQVKKGLINDAILTYEQVVAVEPRADKEYKRLGELYLRMKKTDSALKAYKKYLEKNPSDNAVSLVVGTEAFNVKNYQDAVKYLGMVSGAETKKASYLQQYGDASYNVQDYPRALRVYKDLVLVEPKNAEAYRKLYEISAKNGTSDDALGYLKKYTALKPTDADAQKNLGDLLYGRKEFSSALSSYQAALKANPSIKGLYKNYVDLVLKYGKPQDQMAALNGAISSGEADAGIYGTLADRYKTSANYVKAIELYGKASQLDPKNSEYISLLADCQIKTGDLKNAALSLEQALAMNPAAVKEYKLLGDLYLQQKKTDAAMGAYKKYLEKAPTDYAVAKLIGNFAYGTKDYNTAFKFYGMVKNDDSPQYLLEYGLSAIQVKQPKIAIDLLEKLRALKSTFPSKNVGYKALADAYEEIGNQKKAAEVLNDYIRIPGVKDPDASYKRAAIYESINPAEAVSMYKQNTISYPKDYRNFLKLGVYYSRQKDGEATAVKYFERVTVLSDTIARVWLELGSIYARLKKDQDMLRCYRKYLEVAPENAEAIGKIGEILLSRKMVNDAMVFLEMANSLKENDPKLMTLLARGYLMTKRRTEAGQLLEKVVKISRGNVDDDLRMVLIDVYLESGQQNKAIDELKALLAIKRDKDVLLKYARALYELGKYAEALSTAEEIKKKEPENIEAQMIIGRVKTAQKKYDDAVETYKEILYIDQNYGPALCERASIYLIQGKYQWAQTFYERALKVDPKNAMVHLGLAKLAKQQKDYAVYTEHLEKARRLDPGNKEIQDELKSVKR